ncbi:hypothetical protein [Pedobacter sp. CG_S7]|uniref:hypothetical protein n=1 Tax=Pedobacter sp. CG_S7 TaxID=3143930 RepID=UPI003392D309
MKKLVVILLSILISMNIVGAQEPNWHELDGKISNMLFPQLDATTLPDSVAIYSFAIKLEIRVNNKEVTVDKITVTDSIAYKLFKEINNLKSINFSSIIGKKKSIDVVIPVSIFIMRSRRNPNKNELRVDNLPKNFSNLFFPFNNQQDLVYMNLLKILVDLQEY